MEGFGVLRLVLLCLFAVVPASAEGQEINAKYGATVTLKCEAREYVPLEVVEWSKSEGNMEHVLVFASHNSDPEIPEKNYEGRVELKVTENGEVLLSLKNVTEKDSGIYICYAVKQKNRSPRDIVLPKAVSTIHLKVDPAPSGHEHIGLIVVVVAALVVVALVAVALTLKKGKNRSPPHPHDEAVETLTV